MQSRILFNLRCCGMLLEFRLVSILQFNTQPEDCMAVQNFSPTSSEPLDEAKAGAYQGP
jgi:hypothetical protein